MGRQGSVDHLLTWLRWRGMPMHAELYRSLRATRQTDGSSGLHRGQ